MRASSTLRTTHGKLHVEADGTGMLELTSTEWKLGGGSAQDVISKAIVIHGAGPTTWSAPPQACPPISGRTHDRRLRVRGG